MTPFKPSNGSTLFTCGEMRLEDQRARQRSRSPLTETEHPAFPPEETRYLPIVGRSSQPEQIHIMP